VRGKGEFPFGGRVIGRADDLVEGGKLKEGAGVVDGEGKDLNLCWGGWGPVL
jgi:hypothetical protein